MELSSSRALREKYGLQRDTAPFSTVIYCENLISARDEFQTHSLDTWNRGYIVDTWYYEEWELKVIYDNYNGENTIGTFFS